MERTKWCPKCQRMVSESGWSPSGFKRSSGWCRECIAISSADRRRKNSEAYAARNKAYYEANREARSEYHRQYNLEHRDEKREKARHYYNKNREEIRKRLDEYKRANKDLINKRARKCAESPAPYDTYAVQLYADETCRSALCHDHLMVRCSNHNCRKLFEPTRRQVRSRINAINGYRSIGTECRFYCSDECKNNCPLYGLRTDYFVMENDSEQSYTYQEYALWRDEVQKRNIAVYGQLTCERCGSTKHLKTHHIRPRKTEPFFALDPDYGIVLCDNCHHKTHSPGECGYGSLAHSTCQAKK